MKLRLHYYTQTLHVFTDRVVYAIIIIPRCVFLCAALEVLRQPKVFVDDCEVRFPNMKEILAE